MGTSDTPPDAAARPQRVAMIGYGEVGRIFGAALRKAGVPAVVAFDVLVDDPRWSAPARAIAARDGVMLAPDADAAIAGSDVVISAVTAAQTAAAASGVARACDAGAFVLDVNSASPRTKVACAEAVARAGGRYVEAAVMSSVPPHGLRVPMLLGGTHAQALHPTLTALGFAASVGATGYGVVSAVKLCRSVVVKGMEAIVVEALLAARRHGVEQEVLASLAETFPASTGSGRRRGSGNASRSTAGAGRRRCARPPGWSRRPALRRTGRSRARRCRRRWRR
jgi:3-hydroxyisobutyrate dehydrogenase